MKRPSPLEKKLERLRELRDGSAAPELKAFLAAKEPYLVAAFGRLAAYDGKLSPSTALLRIVEALSKLEADEPDVYRAGLKFERHEWTGDTGVPVRIEAAHALVTTRSSRALVEITPLLADREAAVRAGAARAIGRLGSEGAAAALHLKLLIGDADSEVLGACLGGLLEADAERYLPIVGAYLDGDDDRLAELAAVALGESRAPAAVELLSRGLE